MIIHNRLTRWIEENEKLPECQAGFREKRSTLDNLFVINAAIQVQIRKKSGKSYALFFDLKRAFDSVHHNVLRSKLSKIGISHKILGILRDLYSKANMVVKSSMGINEKCTITKGVF